MIQKECPFEAWQLIQARKILQWLTEGKAMSLGKQTFLERIEDTLFNIAYDKLGLNSTDFKNLKFEDEPVEVFLNLEN